MLFRRFRRMRRIRIRFFEELGCGNLRFGEKGSKGRLGSNLVVGSKWFRAVFY